VRLVKDNQSSSGSKYDIGFGIDMSFYSRLSLNDQSDFDQKVSPGLQEFLKHISSITVKENSVDSAGQKLLKIIGAFGLLDP